MSDQDRWDSKYLAMGLVESPPVSFLSDAHLPEPGRALEIAGGTGRNAVWLTERGWEVTVCDVSPVGLDLARQRAADAGMIIRTAQVDLGRESPPRGPWDLVVCTFYLQRSLFSKFSDLLTPNGCLMVVHPTAKNLERHNRPSRRFLLADGELPGLIEGLRILHYEEGWRDGMHLARLLAQKVSR